MRSWFIVLLLVALLVAGCSVATPTTALTEPPVAVATEAPTVTVAPTDTPTATPEPPTATPIPPTATPASPTPTSAPTATPTAIPTATPTAAAEAKLQAKVVKVVDGDTVKVLLNGKTETLRLIGMDTPEVVDPRRPVQCFGQEASEHAHELLDGKIVMLADDPTQDTRDRYGRLLMYLWLPDGTFFNLQMIKDGYAHEYTYQVPYQYQAEFKAAQREAMENERGLWSPTTCNGDTTQAAIEATPTPTLQPAADSGGHVYYVSSKAKKYYYCDTDSAWTGLSPANLLKYDSEEALKADFPSLVLHEPCH